MPTIACPYCNAAVPLPASTPAGRLPCPRCGEEVPVRTSLANGDVGPDEPSAIPPSPHPAPEQRPSNRAIARIIVSSMLLMAAVTLVYALRTTEQRRANDFKTESRPATVPSPTPPAEWSALGYLPDDVQALAGIRLAAALDTEAGRALLAPLGLSANANRNPPLGVKPEDIEQLLFGATLKALPPRITTVIRTLAPVDRPRIREATHAERTTDRNGKTLTRGRLWNGGPEGTLWFADERTLVAAVLEEDIDKLPRTPKPGADRFAPPLPDLLTQHVPTDALLWLVAHAAPDNATLPVLLEFLGLPQAEHDTWSRLDSLALGVRAEGNQVTLTAWLRGRDSSATNALADAIERSLKSAEVAVERAKSGEGLRLTATADAAALAKWLGQLHGKKQP